MELKSLLESRDLEGTIREAEALQKKALLSEIALGNAGTSRRIPCSKKGLPPALVSDLDMYVKRRAVLWYFNRLPAQTEAEKKVLPTLKHILELEVWRGAVEEDCDGELYSFSLRRDGSQ